MAANHSLDLTSTVQTTRKKTFKVGSASRSGKPPRDSTKTSGKRLDENTKNPFAALSQHQSYFPELDAEMLKLPVNHDSALNRLAGKLKPGDVPSSVPVRKHLIRGKSKASGKGSPESKIQISPSKVQQHPGKKLLSGKIADHMHEKSSHSPTSCLPEISIENEQQVPQTGPAEADSDQKGAAGSNELTPPSFLKQGQLPCFLSADQLASRNALPVFIQRVLPLHILLLESGHDTNQTKTAVAVDCSQPQEPIPRQVLESANQPLYMSINPTASMVYTALPAQMLPNVPLEQRVMFFPGGMPTQVIGSHGFSVQMINGHELSTEMICSQRAPSQITSPQGKYTQITEVAEGTTTKITGIEGSLSQEVDAEETSIQIIDDKTTKQIIGAEGTTRQTAGPEWTTTEISGAEETEGIFLKITDPQQTQSHLISSQIIDFLADSLEMVMPRVLSSPLMSSADNNNPQEAVSPTYVQEESAQGSVMVEPDLTTNAVNMENERLSPSFHNLASQNGTLNAESDTPLLYVTC